VRTVDLPGLLLTRQTPREQDAADRAVLERALAEIERQRGGSGRTLTGRTITIPLVIPPNTPPPP
jgi:hypothetical protein